VGGTEYVDRCSVEDAPTIEGQPDDLTDRASPTFVGAVPRRCSSPIACVIIMLLQSALQEGAYHECACVDFKPVDEQAS
jgi:hypothetical protein